MTKNIKSFILSIFLSLQVFILPLASTLACEIVEVEHPPMYSTRIGIEEINIEKEIQYRVGPGRTWEKAKGILGEEVARHYIEDKGAIIWNDGASEHKITSIITMFRNNGCNVEPYLQDGGGRGIDDIFVLPQGRWINESVHPLFHEAKFDSGCKLTLKPTKTMCGQMSFQWLDANLNKAENRAQAEKVAICFGEDRNTIRIGLCHQCRNQAIKSLEWLQDKLSRGDFERTASLLCPNGDFSIYKVISK